MEEYSRILIEEYCWNHPKTKKAVFLDEMVHMSYDVWCEPTNEQLIQLSKYIKQEKNEELKDALIDLDHFMTGSYQKVKLVIMENEFRIMRAIVFIITL